MNKIQYIKLLELRGITKLEGKTIGDVIRQTGGDPNEKEMIKVNEECMNHYLQKYEEEVSKNKELTNQIEILKEESYKNKELNTQIEILKNEIENNKNIIEKPHSESEEWIKYLEKRNEWLSCLEAAGVDNWEGYDYAIDFKQD